jgi:putative CocE/NonD family hydrolase
LDEYPPAAGSVSFAYDPDNPSPTVGGQTLGWEHLHGPLDQGPVLERDDAMVFVTEGLDASLPIAGRIEVRLAVTTTAADTDFVVRLTDVDHDQRHLLLTDGVHRLKLRDDLSRPSEVVPGERYVVTITLTNDLAYTLARGHRWV